MQRFPMLRRRALLLAALPGAGMAHAAPADALRFPRDLGAHLESRTEWWYVTGQAASGTRRFGFQVTFFRTRVAAAQGLPSRLAARQLLFAHAALTDLASGRLLHDQRIARWNGDARPGLPLASSDDTAVALGDWSLLHAEGRYRARVEADGFALTLDFTETRPLLLQGDAGVSRKGPGPAQSSRYYSLPHLAVGGSLRVGTGRFALDPPGAAGPGWGVAWLDHEWSDDYLPEGAVGWDWIGINLFDGAALMAFRMRRQDGSSLWAGGSFRPAGGTATAFGPADVVFEPGRRWTSPRSGTAYPVAWTVTTPAGRFGLRALQDDQELDSRASTGTVYWEGVSELADGAGTVVGRGYLEMTGYADPLRL